MITDRRGVSFPNVSESAFAALYRRMAGLPPLLAHTEKQLGYATLLEDRDEFWEVLLSDLVSDSMLRAAFRVALTTEEGLNDE